MKLEFDIAGQRLEAAQVRMTGRGLEAQFACDALGAVSDALANQILVGLTGMSASPLYEVQMVHDRGTAGCDVTFEIASSQGQRLH